MLKFNQVLIIDGSIIKMIPHVRWYCYMIILVLIFNIPMICSLTIEEENKIAEQDYGKFNWTKFDIDECKRTGKPMLFMVYTGFSTSCKYFRKSMQKSNKKMYETADKFIMARSDDLEFTRQEMFTPDGEYFPRIFFFDPSGNIMYDVFNTKVPEDYKYYYENIKNLYRSMRKVLKRFNISESTKEESKPGAREETMKQDEL